MKLEQIPLRDPFILADETTKTYYLYGSKNVRGEQDKFEVYKSDNLTDWVCGGVIFEKNEEFWGKTDFWAPEVHKINGKFYMFATFRSPNNNYHRSQILVCDKPDGKFTPLKNALTSLDISALDATYFEADGKAYTFFCHEWIQIGDGTVNMQRLDNELSPIGEPTVLFRASDAPWVINASDEKTCLVTDGPFLRKFGDTYFMLWSSFAKSGYVVGYCTAKDICGPWEQRQKPLLEINGGHAMLFESFNGRLYMVCHAPNSHDEHAVLFEINVENNELTIR